MYFQAIFLFFTWYFSWYILQPLSGVEDSWFGFFLHSKAKTVSYNFLNLDYNAYKLFLFSIYPVSWFFYEKLFLDLYIEFQFAFFVLVKLGLLLNWFCFFPRSFLVYNLVFIPRNVLVTILRMYSLMWKTKTSSFVKRMVGMLEYFKIWWVKKSCIFLSFFFSNYFYQEESWRGEVIYSSLLLGSCYQLSA